MAQKITLEIEPSFIAIGPAHLACGMNNHIWLYDLGQSPNDNALLLGDREYMAEIKECRLNGLYCAVLCGGQIMLHSIETQNPATKGKEPQLFPSNIHGMQESIITSLELTTNFLIFSTDLGNLLYFSLDAWMSVIKYRHAVGIKRIYVDGEGTKLLFIDDHNQGYIYYPVSVGLETFYIRANSI